MFSTANQPAVQHGLIAEVAGSAVFQDALVWVYGALGVFAIVCLLGGYAVSRFVESRNRGSVERRPFPESQGALNPTWSSDRRGL